MCGITGFFGRPDGALPAAALLGRMVSAIAHRGPDASGIFVTEGAGLGHARLSIIDLASGAQPMANADGTIHLSFNGEIFNYIELRRDMIARGRVFRTESDTEVILQLYEELGPACVEHFNGDFAFAIVDTRSRQLMLARDRMGVRPLFYAQKGACLHFASETKALFQVPGISAELDSVALDQIFTLWAPLAPRTPFKGISELPPGHVLIASADGTAVRPYWKLQFPDAGDLAALDNRDEDAIAEELSMLLMDATRIRLRADVPVGAYLSGGLDSSIITAMIRKLAPQSLRTYSVTFDDAEYDEREFQEVMARTLNATHHSVSCSATDIARRFPAVVRHAERPMIRTAPAPLYALSELVRSQDIKVVLTGEGADEVFAGYDIFKEAKLRRFCAAQPQSQRRPLLLQKLYPYLPKLQVQSQSYRAAFFAANAGDLNDPLFSHAPRFRSTSGIKAFYSVAMREELRGYDALAELRESLPADFSKWHPLSQAQYLETVYLLPGYILSSQGDRMAMANAVEGRFPFLDPRVVAFATRIPPRLKLKTLREKHILRHATRDLLPAEIGSRPKQPYRAPESRSFLGADAPDYVRDNLAFGALAAAGLFNPTAVEKLVRKCSAQASPGFRDNAAFVGILSTQLLHREFAAARAAPHSTSNAA
jgi:asparagine synthase (glutamine-hydrolysing)